MIGELVADRVTGHGSGAFSLQDWVHPKLVAITVSGRHLILVICGAVRAGATRPGPDGARRGLPSGHAASAFAFAYTVSRHYPLLAVPLRLLAGAVAFSRVHTGVHSS